ncbi:MAG: LPS assembly protein LptD [Candidatus Thiodiazotropha sp. (ex. Lucinisca nassula)]|nr:LPS assembly protein LptD [Candidatus Thiodiazotropha sp. (ex. Lucinisca nassula)]
MACWFSLSLLWPFVVNAADPSRLDQGISWHACSVDVPQHSDVVPQRPVPQQPIQLTADQISHDQNSAQTELSGAVKLWRLDGYAEADRLTYFEARRAAELFGNLFVQQPGLRFSADQGFLELDNQRGWLDQVEFRLTAANARGAASRVELLNQQQSTYQGVTYTTCPPGKNDWSLAAADLEIDMQEGWGSATHARLRLGSVPILYMPYFTFPVDDRRKTGFLIPSAGSSNRRGTELSTPYYFNLAPNYDATLTPRWMSKRGLMMGAEFRYLGSRQRAEISGELLANDQLESPDHGEERRALRFYHVSRPIKGMTTRIETDAVSDSSYLDDFGTGLAITSTRNLERVGEIRYRLGNWQLLGRVQSFQTIDETLSQSNRPYRRLPQLHTSYRSYDSPFGLSLGFRGEYTHFKHDTLSNGERLILRPSISLPMRRSWGHLTPNLSLNYAAYELDLDDPQEESNPDYLVPAFSLDSGLVFERETSWFGRNAYQTLEPRLFYLYAEHDDQSDIPDFDTADLDLKFSNLFKENRFTGSDRFGDANQLAFGLTTRWFQADNGLERLRASIGQIYYAEDREVQLTGSTEEDPSSAVVAELAARFGSAWQTSLSLRRNPHLEEDNIDKGRFTLRYRTAARQLFNVDYNFKRNSIEDLDVSVFWPFGQQLSVFGKWKHSYLYDRNMNRIVGFEYGGRCCWKLRTFYQRYVANEDKDEEEESRFMLQLELRGLGSLGQQADRELEESIYGYRPER